MSHSVISAANAGSKSKSIVKYLKKKGVSVNDSLIREALSSALGFRTSNEMVAIGKQLQSNEQKNNKTDQLRMTLVWLRYSGPIHHASSTLHATWQEAYEKIVDQLIEDIREGLDDHNFIHAYLLDNSELKKYFSNISLDNTLDEIFKIEIPENQREDVLKVLQNFHFRDGTYFRVYMSAPLDDIEFDF